MALRFQKHFTFFASAPVDRNNVDVACNASVFIEALTGTSVYDNGTKAGAGETANEWANINFAPTQRRVLVPIPEAVNPDTINYMRVDFFDGDFSSTNQTPKHSFFFFVDYVVPMDTDTEYHRQTTPLYALDITIDEWATSVLFSSPTFWGGTLTNASALLPDFLGGASIDDAFAYGAKLPFDGLGGAKRERIYDTTDTAFNEFFPVVQLIGKDLGRAVLLVGEATSLKNAISLAQQFSTTKIVQRLEDGQVVDTFNAGEASIQGAFVLPAYLRPPYTGESGDVVIKWIAQDSIPQEAYKLMEEVKSFTSVTKDFKFGADYDSWGYILEDAPFPMARAVTFGTAYNRVDVSNSLARGGGITDTGIDAFVNAIYGRDTFNIFMRVADGVPKDVTNDFQIYCLTDPENAYIQQNKTNAIISTIGAGVGLVTSVAGFASSPLGAVSGIASGVSTIAKTIGEFDAVKKAPDVISSGGYGDVTCGYGGFYYDITERVGQWATSIKLDGVGRKIKISGEWSFKNATGLNVSAFAVDGAQVRGIPARNASIVGDLLRRGVRIWFDGMAYATRDANG